MGKTEGHNQDWQCVNAFACYQDRWAERLHSGHVTAITVSPMHRRLGLAKSMMRLLERMSELSQCYFVDLYVRISNECALRPARLSISSPTRTHSGGDDV
jgi:N-terminal acetyltransferase B complex catalytic subunit